MKAFGNEYDVEFEEVTGIVVFDIDRVSDSPRVQSSEFKPVASSEGSDDWSSYKKEGMVVVKATMRIPDDDTVSKYTYLWPTDVPEPRSTHRKQRDERHVRRGRLTISQLQIFVERFEELMERDSFNHPLTNQLRRLADKAYASDPERWKGIREEWARYKRHRTNIGRAEARTPKVQYPQRYSNGRRIPPGAKTW